MFNCGALHSWEDIATRFPLPSNLQPGSSDAGAYFCTCRTRPLPRIPDGAPSSILAVTIIATGTFLLLRSIMLQMLAFDPTHRISAEAALKIISRSAQPPPASHTQRAASPPPAACNRVREEDDGGGDGDFWKLESIFGVSGLRSVSIDVCGTRCLFFFFAYFACVVHVACVACGLSRLNS